MSEHIDKGVMRQPVVCSLLLHAVVVILVGIGLPLSRDVPLPVEEPVVVDLVPVADRSNPPVASQVASRAEAAKPATPPPAKSPEPPSAETRPAGQAEQEPAEPNHVRPEPLSPPARKPESGVEARPAAKPDARPDKPMVEPSSPKAQPKATTPPAPSPEARPEQRPEPKAEPRPQQKPKPPEPKAEQKPEPKAEPKPEPKANAEPRAEPRQSERKPDPARQSPAAKPEPAKPEHKPEPATDFAAVQKTVSALKQQNGVPTRPAKPAESKERESTSSDADSAFTSRVAQALRSSAPSGGTDSLPVTSSEIDAVRRQIERCWNVPDGAKDAPDLVVALRVEMNMDGTPRSAVVEGSSRGQNNSYFQAAAESARRAVLNPRCHPFKFPPDKFDRWRTITLIFNPREMAGT